MGPAPQKACFVEGTICSVRKYTLSWYT